MNSSYELLLDEQRRKVMLAKACETTWFFWDYVTLVIFVLILLVLIYLAFKGDKKNGKSIVDKPKV